MKKILLFLSLLFFLSTPLWARIYIVVDEPSEKTFPIGINPLKLQGEGGDKKKWATALPKVLQSDLEITGLFEIIDPLVFPERDRNNITPDQVQFSAWTLIGAQAVVKGSLEYVNERMIVELFLYDPLLGQKLVGRRYIAQPNEMRVVAHHFADEIILALTGERGIFSTKLSFVSDATKNKEIYVMDVDGGNHYRLTRNKSINLHPAWSPTGRWIAYTSFATGYPEIYVADIKEKTQKRLTGNQTANLSPTWKPDTDLVTMSSSRKGDAEIYLLSLKGIIEQQLTKSYGIDLAPSWSPDGSAFTFASERSGRLHIFRADADGGNVKRLTYVGYHNDRPAWSPKGDKIVFQGRDQGVWDLFIMNPDGTNIQRLTAGEGNNESPVWSPNGRYLAFSSNRTGRNMIYIMRPDGSNQIAVSAPGNCTQPSWSPYFK
jgi:TolB protein